MNIEKLAKEKYPDGMPYNGFRREGYMDCLKEYFGAPYKTAIKTEEETGNPFEKVRIEGILTGLKICKEMWAQGTISHESIHENEVFYNEELKNV